MKPLRLIFSLLIALSVSSVYAQTVDEIINKYLEATGGVANWKKLEGVKMYAKVNQGGLEIPLEIYQLKDGRQMTVINFQGKTLYQNVYDGQVLWSTNFMTMKAEKSDAETTEIFKVNSIDFPDPFLDYGSKGYKVELLGKETVEGTETFKIKLTRKPITVDGKAEENVAFYYFDAADFIPIMVEAEMKAGPAKGMVSQTSMSDYQEVNGVFFPFSMATGMKGGGKQAISISKIELNPQVEASAFTFKEDK